MKPSLLLPALILLASSALRTNALVSVQRAADHATSIPVVPLSAAELNQPTADILDHLKQALANPLPAADLAELKRFPPFLGQPDDQAVRDLFKPIPMAMINSIEIIRREDSTAASALAYVLNNRRISLGFGGQPGADVEIRDNGSARYGSEAITFFYIPQPLPGQTVIRPYDLDGFRLCHSLASAGHYITVPGYEGKPPQTVNEQTGWALANQIRAITVGTRAVDRLTSMTGVLTGIVANLTIPEGSDGIARSIGRSLLMDTGLTDVLKRQKARDLLGFIQGDLLPAEQTSLDARIFYRDTLQLTLAGRLPSSSGYNGPFKKSGYFINTVQKPGTDHPYTSYYGGYASINTSAATPTLQFDNRLWRITGKADGNKETETITIGELGGISLAGFDGRQLIVGGPTADFSQFRFFGFNDADSDGRVEADSKRQLFDSSLFLDGADWAWNPADGMGYVLDRGTRDIYQLRVGDDGFPIGTTQKGTLGTRSDLAWLNFSYDGKWALGLSDFGGYVSPYGHHSESYYDSKGALFEPLRLTYDYEEYQLPPAVAGPVVPGKPIRFTGTPDREYRALTRISNMWVDIGAARTDPNGAGVFDRSATPLEVGQGWRISSDIGELSPDYTITTDYTRPEFFTPKLGRGDNLRLGFGYQPDYRVDLLRGTSLGNFDVLDFFIVSAFGTGFFNDCLPDPPASSYFWRMAATEPETPPQQDYYYIPPGTKPTVYLGWNDPFRTGVTYTLDAPSAQAASVVPNATINERTAALIVSVSTFFNVDLTYRIYQDNVFRNAVRTVIYPDLERLLNPPINFDVIAGFYVPIKCLVINGKNYPALQFRLAYPDACLQAHWHGPRVYHLDNDSTGISDPAPSTCGFGSVESIPVVDVDVPFEYWLLYRAAVILRLPRSGQSGLADDAFCGPEAKPL
jgi:hypothetical protein